MTKSRDLANAATALSAVSATELGYVDGVTSAIQTQLDAKLATATAATTYVPNSLADAKGDIFVASADNTVTRLPVGSTGDTIVADSSTSTGLRYQGNYAAGKNKIINGDFGIWQRGTSFTFTGTGGYTADRFEITSGGGGVVTVTQGAFTPGTAPVAGVESQYFINLNYTASGTGASDNGQYIEDVRTFAGQTVTVSVYAKVSSGTHSITPQLVQRFGSGGSSAGATSGTTFTATTSWQRFTATINVPSVTGKTIGAGSSLQFRLDLGTTGVKQFQFWGVQVEAGSVATAFQTATGTIQGELAACQRYYWRQTTKSSNYSSVGNGYASTTTAVKFQLKNPVTMRTEPSSIDSSGLYAWDGASLIGGLTSATLEYANETYLNFTAGTGAGSFTANRPYSLVLTYPTAYIGCSAEL
jgi:hypothetical protein